MKDPGIEPVGNNKVFMHGCKIGIKFYDFIIFL